MKKLYFATQNAHKTEEVRAIMATLCDVISAAEVGIHNAPEETEATLEGNALLKARALRAHLPHGAACFADDTGLLVEALDGAPGVHSARFSGPQTSDQRNREKLLAALKEFPTPHHARFVTVIAYIDAAGKEWLFTGEVAGEILPAERGAGGFGYDPLFLPCGSSKTFAEMPAEEKNQMSHRRKALEKLRTHLEDASDSAL